MINQEMTRESSCVAFMDSMKEKIELLMKVGDISNDFTRHSFKSERRRSQMDPDKLALFQEIRKECEEGGVKFSVCCRNHGIPSNKLSHHAYTYGWDIPEFKTKRYQNIHEECERLHDYITFHDCNISSAVDGFNVTEKQYAAWRARQRSINK